MHPLLRVSGARLGSAQTEDFERVSSECVGIHGRSATFGGRHPARTLSAGDLDATRMDPATDSRIEGLDHSSERLGAALAGISHCYDGDECKDRAACRSGSQLLDAAKDASTRRPDTCPADVQLWFSPPRIVIGY